VATDRAGRVRVQNDLSVAGHPEIFVIRDTASLDQDGHPLPGVAQVAIQQGRFCALLLWLYDEYSQDMRSYTLGWYSTLFALGFSSLLCFMFGYLLWGWELL
jgi:NADH dehydrogenase FAD-containing subunit